MCNPRRGPAGRGSQGADDPGARRQRERHTAATTPREAHPDRRGADEPSSSATPEEPEAKRQQNERETDEANLLDGIVKAVHQNTDTNELHATHGYPDAVARRPTHIRRHQRHDREEARGRGTHATSHSKPHRGGPSMLGTRPKPTNGQREKDHEARGETHQTHRGAGEPGKNAPLPTTEEPAATRENERK